MNIEDIRKLDGPGLSQLAYDLGLAPEGTTRHSDGRHWAEEGPQRQWVSWRPHERVDQAAACFRQLRPRGWSLSTRSQQAEEPGSMVLFGRVESCYLATLTKVVSYWSTAALEDPEMDATEALALLRVAVLALAHPCTQEVPGD